MGFPFEHHGQTSRLWRGLSLVLATAVVLAILAPSIDHHSAERQLDHSHVYLTAASASFGHPNVHPFEQNHPHGATSINDSGDYAGPSGILYQTSGDRSEDSGSIVPGAIIDDSLIPLGGRDSLSLVIGAGDNPYPEALVALPKRPPRT